MDAWWRWPSFGYPDAASDAFKSSVGYKDWLVDEKDVAGDERVVRRRPEDGQLLAWAELACGRL